MDAIAMYEPISKWAVSVSNARNIAEVVRKNRVTEVKQRTDGAWDVVKPMLADRWLTKGKFHHESHQAVECGECHAAAASKEASDVLLPAIGKCHSCHGGEKASAKVPSACIMCHDFHNPAFPPMKAATRPTRRFMSSGGIGSSRTDRIIACNVPKASSTMVSPRDSMSGKWR